METTGTTGDLSDDFPAVKIQLQPLAKLCPFHGPREGRFSLAERVTRMTTSGMGFIVVNSG